ncbi:MAG: TlpA disulfide reductase family protein [bacterium]
MNQLCKTGIALFLAVAMALAMAVSMVACSQTGTEKLELPTVYSEETITQARELTEQGYALLDSSDFEGALTKFTEAGELVPMAREFHTACAYARSGETEAACQWLTRLSDNGFDVVDRLLYEGDFELLQDEPQFESVVDRVKANHEAATESLVGGLADHEVPPVTFDTEEALTEWADEQERVFRRHYYLWTSKQQMAAQLDHMGKYLAAERTLKQDAAEYDYGLERIRTVSTLKSVYEPGWGGVTRLIVDEVESYLATSPAAVGAGEAHYRAGTALSLQYADDDERQVSGFQAATNHLDQVPADTEYHGAAQALKTVNALLSPGAETETYHAQLRNIIAEHPGDAGIRRVMSTRLNHDTPSILWPLEIEAPDLEGDLVTVGEYHGKVLLIDFWATWCSPCREEIPHLVELYELYHAKGFSVVSISLDYLDRTDEAAYREWIAEAGMDWRHIYDGNGWDSELVKRFFVGSIPAPFLVGPDGSLMAWGEACRGEELTSSIERALAMKTE